MKLFNVRAARCVSLEDLTLPEVTVLPEYFIEAGNETEALEEFYWNVPIEDHRHFNITIGGAQ